MEKLEVAKRRTLKKVLVVAVVMFGFGFAMIPFYRKICEVTGVNLLDVSVNDQGVRVESKKSGQSLDESRWVTLQFDATPREGWKFRPLTVEQRIHPGQLIKVEYEAENLTATKVKAQAIPSYSPLYTQRFFQKLECFCFRQQWFESHEKKRLAVILRIDPALPKEVSTMTLSYTLFRIEGV
jgi:cytochrome c oxidase assembly protein subunit 11